MSYWFPDNSVIVNFAHLDRLEMLRNYLRGNGRVVQAVANEIVDSGGHVPQLAGFELEAWFGKVIRVTRDAERDTVENIRRFRFGGDRFKPKEHLGESETLYVIQNKPTYRDSVWITEDGDAYRFGKQQGIITKNTFDVLCDLVGSWDLTAADAHACMERLSDPALDRHLIYYSKKASDFER